MCVCLSLRMQLSRHSFAFFFIYENIGFRHFLLNPRNVDLCNLRYLSTRPEPFEPSGNIWIAQDIWSLVRAIVLFCLLLGWFTQRRPVVACSMTLGRPAFSFSGRANKVVQVSPQQSETRAGEINSFGFYGFGQKPRKWSHPCCFRLYGGPRRTCRGRSARINCPM